MEGDEGGLVRFAEGVERGYWLLDGMLGMIEVFVRR